jgi:hypothetical protein
MPRKPLPKSPCDWDQGSTRRIYEALGLNSTGANKIPKNMHGRYKVDGYTVIVKRSAPGQRGTGKHRVFVDIGGRDIPAGRVYQAACQRYKLRQKRRRAARAARR